VNSAPGSAVAITADEWERAVTSIEEAPAICLACHVCPDGDALGSMLAFAQALRAHGKPVTASFGDAFVVPRILRFLPGMDLLTHPGDYPAEPDVMVTFDAASRDRLGSLAANASKARDVIVLDHHSSNTRFGTTHLVDPSAPATAAVAEELIGRLGVPLTHDIALDLYVGLVTDTGSFKHAATTPEVHALAGRLLATGIRPELVAREVWDRAPFGYLPVLSAALGRATLEPQAAGGLGMVWTTVTRADRVAHDLPYDLVEGVIDVVRRTEEAEVAIVFKEDDEGAWQVSTRSKGRVDVGMACVALGGGGHPAAAGFTLHGDVAQAVQRLRELFAQIEVATRS
jgi:bifunctional oligoribonuclease and PAP phosphatase NrnA